MAANYYDVLNVAKEADGKTISDAYKKMALKWHPDKNPDNIDEANQRFKEISEAYQVLSDAAKRLRYDRGQSLDDHHHHHHSYDSDDEEFGSFFHFVSPEMLFRHFFRRFEATHDFFCTHDDDWQNNRSGRRYTKAQEKKRPTEMRHTERRRENTGAESCHTRTVNGKQWMTKTHYEDGKKIVTRYEDGELVSKQVNGVSQKI